MEVRGLEWEKEENRDKKEKLKREKLNETGRKFTIKKVRERERERERWKIKPSFDESKSHR